MLFSGAAGHVTISRLVRRALTFGIGSFELSIGG